MIDDLDEGAGVVDTSIAAEERLTGDGAAPKSKPTVAEAGRAFLASLKPEQLATELTGLDDDDAIAEEGHAAVAAAESIVRPEDGATWKPEAGRWVNAAGQFVAGAAPDGAPTAPAARAAAPAPAPAAAAAPANQGTQKEEPAAGTVEKITLAGLTDRGEEDIELEIDDPIVAERLRRLAKDGLRGAAAREQRRALDADRERFAQVTAEVEDDPTGFVINRMSPERQIEVARALILEHLDALLPEIEELVATPGMRSDKRLELQRNLNKSAGEAQLQRETRAYAGQVMNAVEALIPDDADPEDAREFIQLSRQRLAALSNAGTKVTPENVGTLLARQLKFAGYSGQPAPAAASPAAPAARSAAPVARPATPQARAIAARSPSIEEATRAGQRVRRVQTQRAAATRVAPAGAGAAPVSVPLLPPEAKGSVRAASAYLRKQGLPDTWGAPAE